LSFAQTIFPIRISDEMKDSYIDYAMSVIVSRALPDVRDGLKPVHRRILYAMDNLGLTPDKPFKKSATVVGDVIGKYHPHGDAAVYDALVRMAQDFSMRYPLVEGHGNFGSIDGDPPAAYRYTEARLSKIALTLLEDLDKETVDFRPNFDNTQQEPVILPAKLPNLLINGSSGIAVGMATNIPPHNLSEVVDGIVAAINTVEVKGSGLNAELHVGIPDEELLKYIPGPDFPTAGLIMGREGIREAFLKGRGSITMRAKTHFEQKKGKQHEAIIVTEIPYQVNKARLIESIAELVRDKKITGISDIRDESDRTGMRIVIELRSDAIPQIVLNQLFKHTALQSNFGVIMLALVDGVPRICTLKEIIAEYLKHRYKVVTRRSQFELRKARERAHLLEGLLIALDHLDEVISLIRNSKDPAEAREKLIEQFKLSVAQADGILDMRLQRLTGLERQKIQEEHAELLKTIKGLEELLASSKKILEVIKKEILSLKEKFGDARRTQIVDEMPANFQVEDLLPHEDMVITVSHSGYIKRIALDTYRAQHRGGKGVQGAGLKTEDFIEHLFVADTHDYLLIFTNTGRVFRLKVHEVPEASRQARGTALVNLLEIPKEEKVAAIFPVKSFDTEHYLFMATRKGKVKKTSITEYNNIYRSGLMGINLEEGDTLIGVQLTDGEEEVILGTKNGFAIRFDEKLVRPMGRRTQGVRGVRLREGDEVVAMDNLRNKKDVLVVTSNGYGKRSDLELYRVQGRGGVGVKNIKVNEKTGYVVGLEAVNEEDEVMVITKNGQLIRVHVKDISRIGRDTQGVRIIRLEEGDEVTALAHLEEEDEEPSQLSMPL
jgi:DNA gyrase subunit A